MVLRELEALGGGHSLVRLSHSTDEVGINDKFCLDKLAKVDTHNKNRERDAMAQ